MDHFPELYFWVLAVTCIFHILQGNQINFSSQNECKKLIIDVDTGVDDATAIVMALALGHDVVAITVAAGNTDMENGYNNTLRTLKVMNRTDIPVYKGADRPIDGRWQYEAFFFGNDSFGGVATQYPMGKNPAVKNMTYAPLKMIELIREYPGEFTLVLLGPLTNLAIALLADPYLTEDVRDIFILGGNYEGKGNIYPGSEFNFLSDPDAAQIVLQRSTCNVTVVPWETVTETFMPWDNFYAVTNQTGPKATFLRDITNHTIYCCLLPERCPGYTLSDILAVLAAVVPESVTKLMQNRVDVEKCGTHTMGMLVHGWFEHMIPDVRKTVNLIMEFNNTIVAEYFNKTFM